MKAAAHVLVSGRVQGVGYRFFAEETAEALGLSGWVRNRPGGDVEAHAEGSRSAIEAWAVQLKKGPPLARIDSVQLKWLPPSNQFRSFTIQF